MCACHTASSLETRAAARSVAGVFDDGTAERKKMIVPDLKLSVSQQAKILGSLDRRCITAFRSPLRQIFRLCPSSIDCI
jgi:hypothetical protein